ncbi:hypothetical protein Dsin_023249 [Dipteronia sinensis]|uniref:Non-specific lipid-transfer protein n=1 Tax=Dipteronia sinensis TaxID=43782 RepID=A0AAE0A377_9ROSI|nr:hypothetical protein Dsin_023249 [Dipteronia sinensis]
MVRTKERKPTKYSMAVLVVSMFLVPAHATLTCEQVTLWLTPCISYGVMGGIVAPGCCSGLKALDDVIKTNEDVRTACYCIKDRAAKIPGLNYDRANELPGICGTTDPIKLSPSLDCSKATLT